MEDKGSVLFIIIEYSDGVQVITDYQYGKNMHIGSGYISRFDNQNTSSSYIAI